VTTSGTLLIRNAEIDGVSGRDVRIAGGRIEAVGSNLAAASNEWDARGGALIPGLIDHHIHLLATAARADSLSLDTIGAPAGFLTRLRDFAAARAPGNWVRAIGYHERMAGLLTRHDLDLMAPRNPVRIQHQTGSLWMLNSQALAIVVGGEEPPACVERDDAGSFTGRIWRGDAWLAHRLAATPPALAPLAARLAALGVTGLMDASVSTDDASAAVLADARRKGALPQHLALMSGASLTPCTDAAYRVGPLKIMLDEHDLPPLDEIIRRIGLARAWGRCVAVHCVTAAELALSLAAFETAGAKPGDRIEHGGVIPAEAIAVIARLGLTVVTQPGFVFERGDRYLADVDRAEQGDLYRCASLLAAAVPVASSSDAPYSAADPWSAMRAAVNRRTRAGLSLGVDERVPAATALQLHLGDFDAPGGPSRRVAPGAPADLCLLKTPLRAALAALSSDLVAATIIAGDLAYP
jgi:predicted amidohydrolase YtcJ